MKTLTFYDSARLVEDSAQYLGEFLDSESGLARTPQEVVFNPGEKLMKITVTVEEV